MTFASSNAFKSEELDSIFTTDSANLVCFEFFECLERLECLEFFECFECLERPECPECFSFLLFLLALALLTFERSVVLAFPAFFGLVEAFEQVTARGDVRSFKRCEFVVDCLRRLW